MKDNRERIDLTGLDDATVEKLAARYPLNDEETKNRIMEKFLEKTGCDADASEEDEEPAITVSGTERYRKPLWSKYITTAAALALAFGGIFGLMKLDLFGGSPVDPAFATAPAATEYRTEAVTEPTAPEATEEAAATAAENYAPVEERATTAVTTDTSSTSETTETTDSTGTEETGTGTDTATEAATEPSTSETTPAGDIPDEEEIKFMLTGRWIAETESGERIEYVFETYSDGTLGGMSVNLAPENVHAIGTAFDVTISGKQLLIQYVKSDVFRTAELDWEGDSLRDGFTLVWDDGNVFTFTPVTYDEE